MRLEDMVNKEKKLNILTIDIETSPIIGYVWGPKWETNIIDFIEHSNIICYSAKWLDGKQITEALSDYKYNKKNINDKPLVKNIYKLIDKADIVITQNGVSFDMKMINSRFIKHGLSPPSPYKNIDTKIEAKKYLRLPSYSLDDMGEYFGLGRKIQTGGFDLWKKCLDGDKGSWNLMKKYNAQDVRLTEQVYLKLRPFMKTHPNTTLYTEKPGCPKCGSEDVFNRGFYTLTSGKYHRASCNDCGGWFRYGKAIPLENKKTKGTNI
jgi:DNA polymerase elongation subunit (family B)